MGDGVCAPQEALQTLLRLAPGLAPEQLAAVALHVASASSARGDGQAGVQELHRQLAEATSTSSDTISAYLRDLPAYSPEATDSLGPEETLKAQACASLMNSKVQLLFELWDRDGDGNIGFAEVALAFRKFCPAMQRLQGTAADAAEALFLYGNGDLQLDRLQFGRMLAGLSTAIGCSQSVLLDLLIILATVDDRPAEEMTLLLAESALQQKVAARQVLSDDNSVSAGGSTT
ncbi:hypothetical protein WJX73_003173 [Symbiochloris irregularis]|uniref:EF-hand domain-containing protein n=1 Tax=Symbiochloris irregularis TaxID=706552 RepID=A0AAW1P095_9CHLO